MKDKEFLKEKKRCQVYFNKWIKRLGLTSYQIDIHYKMGDSTSAIDNFQKCLDVSTRWEYRKSLVNVWVETLPDDEWKLENMILHELCHIMVHPMRAPGIMTDKELEMYIEKEEYAVEGLSRAFMWTAAAAKDEALKKPKKKK